MSLTQLFQSVSSVRRLWRPFVTAALAITWTPGQVRACPAYLKAENLAAWLGDASLANDLRLFARTTKDGRDSQWVNLPVQVDPLNQAGVLDAVRLSAPKDQSQNRKIAGTDRIVFEVSEFGAPVDQNTPPPCASSRIAEVVAPSQAEGKRHAYLAICQETSENTNSKTAAFTAPPRVHHDERGQKLASSFFEYQYLPTNQLLFKTLTARLPDDRWVTAGRDSDFRLRLDLKRFFTMNFTNQDVESYVEATHAGPVGVSGLINFYLRLLMFKIDLKMATLASFYERSANIPMIVDIPMPAERHLNIGSGMIYTYKLDETKLEPTSGTAFPIAHASQAAIKGGPQELAKIGLTNCQNDKCLFRLQGAVATEKFVLDMEVPRTAVARGFYPLFIPEVAQFKESMGWKVDEKQDAGRIGFYFENSGLEKGRFQMDYWIRFASDAGNSVCPAPAIFERTLDLPTLVGAPVGRDPLAH